MGVRVMVGTAKGGFWLASEDRRRWDVEGPFFKGWKVTAGLRLSDGRFMAAVASDVYGPALHVSDRCGSEASWEQLPKGPEYGGAEGRRLAQIWTVKEHAGTLYAGVQDAGLFSSPDFGASWTPVAGLNDHPTREAWMPGAGGLCCHAVLFAPDSSRMWCGISAVGVFRSDDGGATWTPRNGGVPPALEDERHKGIGTCVHALAQDPANPDRLYRQDHVGMFRSRDGGDSWERNEKGLATAFGFPVLRDPVSGFLYCAPQEGDQHRVPAGGALTVMRSSDDGDSWHSASSGLPRANAYGTVLRHALAGDGLDPGGLYVGTTSGTLHASRDLGEEWTTLPVSLPRILHVSAWVD